MTNGLDLVAKDFTTRRIETIELGIGLNTNVVLVVIVETCQGINHLLLILFIPRPIKLL